MNIERFIPIPVCVKCGMEVPIHVWNQGALVSSRPLGPVIQYCPPGITGPNDEQTMPAHLMIKCPVCGYQWEMHTADYRGESEKLYT